jgi:menaquinone-specific isochorismate synthase
LEIIPENSPPRRDRETLVAFLGYCQKRAIARGRPQIASICLRVGHISPLAVLQSIFNPREAHFYMENPGEAEAVAGAEAIWQETFTGKSRFADAQVAMESAMEDIICIGDLDHKAAGPRFFFFHTFQDDPEPGSNFAPGTLFLPRWQVVAHGSDYFAVANLPVTPDSPLEPIAEKILAAHRKFQVYDYPDPQPESPGIEILEKTEPQDDFEANVDIALEGIRKGKYEKLVLSRAIDIRLSAEGKPLDWLNRLREKYRECFSFSVSAGNGESFIGLSPELLLHYGEHSLRTEALAGSAPRGKSAGADARLAGELLASVKDLHEHHLVAASIIRRLGQLGLKAESQPRPGLRVLPNVQHLLSRIVAKRADSKSFWQTLRALHPTPAVGGTPRENVMAEIARLETHPRGLYAGTLGWVMPDGQGQAIVAIRSALVEKDQVRLYAGAGIVEGSKPELEKRETDLKFGVMLEALGGEAHF